MFKGVEHLSEPGAPTIIIPNRIAEKFGDPTINFDGLSELFEEKLHLPAGETTLKFYGGTALGEIPPPGDLVRNGWRTPYSNTYHIPASNLAGGSPMKRVIALGLKTEQVRERSLPLRFLATEVTIASTPLLVAGLIEDNTPVALAGEIGLLLTGMAKANSTDPAKGVSSIELQRLREAHDSDIMFAKQNLRYLDQ